VPSKSIALRRRYGSTSTWMSAPWRQPTATQGFDGVKLNMPPSPSRVMRCERSRPARSS